MKIFWPITFNQDTFKVILDGLKLYKKDLEENLKISKEFDLFENPIEKELNLVNRILEFSEEKYKKADIDLEVKYEEQLISFFKSAILLNLDRMKLKKTVLLADKPFLPKTFLDAIDQKVAFMNDKLNLPVFKGIEPRELIISKLRPMKNETRINTISGSGLEVIEEETKEIDSYLERTKENIFILDDVLSKRVKDLLGKGKDGLYDRPIREVATVIEERLRKKANLSKEFKGVELASKALNNENGILIISEDKEEQAGIHLIFSGFFKFLRNPNQHNLDDKLTRERAIQIVGFGDYLLSLLENTKFRETPK